MGEELTRAKGLKRNFALKVVSWDVDLWPSDPFWNYAISSPGWSSRLHIGCTVSQFLIINLCVCARGFYFS